MIAETTDTAIWVAAIGAFGALCAAVIAAWSAHATRRDVKGVHNSVNSKMDALLKAARDLARIEGRDEERDRVKRETP